MMYYAFAEMEREEEEVEENEMNNINNLLQQQQLQQQPPSPAAAAAAVAILNDGNNNPNNNNVGSSSIDDDELDSSIEEENLNTSAAEFPIKEESIDRTLVSDLQSHLYDPDICDVTLRGTDDRSVMAVRSILAMRSRFFKSLLFGNFQESTQDEVPLGFSSLVLRAVVEYCYTDEIKLTFENLSFEDTARSMVGLVAAGSYFELGGLLSRAYRLTCLMMDEYPALSCLVLDETISGKNKCVHTEELSRVALGIIRLRTESALLPPDTYESGVQSLGEAALELVMSDNQIQAGELQLFFCLKKWAEHYAEEDDDDNEEDNQRREEVLRRRRSVAQRLASRIDFSKVAPSALATTVTSSDLVPLEVMVLAYKTQALQAERKGLAFDKKNNNDGSREFGINAMRTSCNDNNNGCVMVQGAGLSEVNGAYKSSFITRNTTRYERDGYLPGYGPGKFLLHILIMHDDTRKWLLSFRCTVNSGLKEVLDLYTAPVFLSEDEIVPPMQKWVSCPSAHEKLHRRMLAATNRKSQKKKKKKKGSYNNTGARFAYSGESEENGIGDPPPICIWLPGHGGGNNNSNTTISEK